jgi:hypothetical protein
MFGEESLDGAEEIKTVLLVAFQINCQASLNGGQR